MGTYGPKDYDAERLRQLEELRRQSGQTSRLPRPLDLSPQTANAKNKYIKRGQEYSQFFPLSPDDYDVDFSVNELVDENDIGPANDRPVPLTDIPTSSTNAKRPYTVAAGWQRYPGQRGADDAKGTLTIMFRDGTLYNYYNVENSVWIKFHSSLSKGAYLNRNSVNPLLNSYNHGPASLEGVSFKDQEKFYIYAREAQLRYKRGKYGVDERTGKRVRMGEVVPKSARAKAGYGTARSAAKKLGQNPSTGGKNPYSR